jgi:hypothetical protein
MSIIPAIAIQKAEVGGSQFKISPGKISVRTYLKNKLKAKGLGARLKW